MGQSNSLIPFSVFPPNSQVCDYTAAFKKVQKRDIKNIKNGKGYRDSMPKSIETR